MNQTGRGRLQDKVAIVVGAGQQPGESIGNGRAVAERYAQEGAKLLLVDIQPEWLDDTLQSVLAHGAQASAWEIGRAHV